MFHLSIDFRCTGARARLFARRTGAARFTIFALYKASQLELHESLELLADSGYQGLAKLHERSRTPKKKSKKRHLTKDERCANRALSRSRIVVENVIRRLKIFRILLECYRNRRKRFSLRFNLIAGLYNFELSL